MLKTKIKFFVMGLVLLLLSGCYEINLFSIEIREDLSSSVRFITTTHHNMQEYFQEAQEELEKCGFETQNNLRNSRGVSFSAKQNFETRTDLELAASCNSFTNQTIKVYPPVAKEEVLGTTFLLKLEILALEGKDNNQGRFNQVPFREIRITLPGKINTSVDNLPNYIKVNSSVEGTGTAILKFININEADETHYDEPDADLESSPIWELQGSIYIEASSYKSKIEIKWLLTTVLGLLTFILGNGTIKYFSRKDKRDET